MKLSHINCRHIELLVKLHHLSHPTLLLSWYKMKNYLWLPYEKLVCFLITIFLFQGSKDTLEGGKRYTLIHLARGEGIIQLLLNRGFSKLQNILITTEVLTGQICVILRNLGCLNMGTAKHENMQFFTSINTTG